ncbi:type I polyketide synthase [cf. Phormidesmis sp. LEGE 11477]|uniref:type I polyketide synthase n=1 Tax=cf. Phormidesmis sp. LEGE 11477 TaxID=1828680 RepID=UPI00187F3A1D|nr:type I polyketide synthase [cf. Phormidesmis sp. LEGE 11477]MBE9060857.1 SDR family NAD(P)-dependent oxidoreductase [cf. Phormidesmis sp. LEGE 11477]
MKPTSLQSANSSQSNNQQRMTRALQAIEKLQAKLAKLEAALGSIKSEPIAIVGMGCRFPGGTNSPTDFWKALSQGKDAITQVPSDRWDADAYYDPNPDTPGKIITRDGGFVDHLKTFDADFFGISPREAVSLDPQQRLLLEVSWEAMEHGGIVPSRWTNRPVGIFVGVSSNDYSQYLSSRAEEEIGAYLATGNAHSVIAGRLSYSLGFTGPSLVVDTACSSSLVAVHLACQSLRNQECEMAIAGGVNRILAPEFSINFSKAHMLSPDGRCKTFDAAADGFARGEGCGAVVLKRLSDAIAHGDNILALVRGAAVNQDGRSGGLTVPNGPSQQVVIRQALASAGVKPAQVSYIEAHGTGTALGDPIEIGALGAVFGQSHSVENPLKIGSVKTNIGHLEAAAGMAGLIKVVLAMQHDTLPAHLHFNTPSPHIDWAALPVEVTQKSTAWSNDSDSRFAGVSSFGFSGTNAHVVVESAPKLAVSNKVRAPKAGQPETDSHLLTLSAKDSAALRELAAQYAERLAQTSDDLTLRDFCWSAGTGRSHFSYRLALVTDSLFEAQNQLAAYAHGSASEATINNASWQLANVAFLFTGQGAQTVRMGQGLYDSEPIFRATIDRCDKILTTEFDRSLLGILYPSDALLKNAEALIDQTENTQPALFAIAYALVELWKSWGINPKCVLGHSVGEYAAAAAAGIMSWEDGLRLIAHRGRLMQKLPAGGGMAAVMAAATQIQPYLQPGVAIAAENGPTNTVLSGSQMALKAVLSSIAAKGIQTQKLKVSHGFHSPLMQPILKEFEAIAQKFTYHRPQLEMISTVTGESVGAVSDWPKYWTKHIQQPVRFWKGIDTLIEKYEQFVEIGPKPILSAMGKACSAQTSNLQHQRQQDQSTETSSVKREKRWLPSLYPNRYSTENDRQTILSSLGHLYVQGANIAWPREATYRVELPTYPFQRKRYWIDIDKSHQTANHTPPRLGSIAAHPLVGQPIPLAGTHTLRFQSLITPTAIPFLQEHQVYGKAVLPAVGYLEMALSAVLEGQSNPRSLNNINFYQALLLDRPQTLQTVITPLEADTAQQKFEIFSLQDHHQWQLHASGYLTSQERIVHHDSLEQLQKRCNTEASVANCYQRLERRGITYGDSFRAIQQIYVGDRNVLSRLQLPVSLQTTLSDYQFHPVLLDACLQSIVAASEDEQETETYLPAAIEQIHVYVEKIEAVAAWSYVEVSTEQQWPTANIQLFSLAGEPLISIVNLRLQPATKEKVIGAMQPAQTVENWAIEDWFYTINWQAQPLPEPVNVSALIHALADDFGDAIAQPAIQSYLAFLPQLEALSLSYIKAALAQLNENVDISPVHHPLFRRLQTIASANPPIVSTPSTQQQILSQYPEARAELSLIQRCGESLAQVLQGNVDPLTLLIPSGDLSDLTQLYQASPGALLMNQQVHQVVERLIANNPQPIRILEIGAGTGGTTAHLLPLLSEAAYTFTDISPLFLAKAKERFADYSNLIYQQLDIEQSIEAQGFCLNSYDLVIAANVLHATADIEQVLARVRSLLIPGGQLILLEGTQPLIWLDLIFGMTAGWWKRSEYPLLSVSKWQQHLRSVGFESAELMKASNPSKSEALPQSVIVASVSSAEQTLVELAEKVLVVAHADSALGTQITQATRGKFVLIEEISSVSNLLSSETWPEQIVYIAGREGSAVTETNSLEVLVEKDATGLLNLVRSLSAQARPKCQLNIVTQGIADGNITGSIAGLSQAPLWGLARVVELEYPRLDCRRIDLDPNNLAVDNAELLCQELKARLPEKSVVYRQRTRQVARLASGYSLQSKQQNQLTVPNEPFKLALSTKGSPDNLQLVPCQRRQPEAGEIEIRVLAAGLNFIDVLDALALLPFERDWLGVECAGVVVAVGVSIEHFAVGDRVLALAAGSFSQYVTVPAELAIAQPQNLSAQAAAAIPANFLTAYYALQIVAKLKKGDRVLIHAAAGGTGMAAVKVAQLVGAEIYATASPRKWKALKEMGVQHIMNSRTLDFADGIMAKTGGQGVDVILNSLSGDFLEKSTSVVAEDGCFVEIGKRDIWSQQKMNTARADVDYHIVDLMSVAQQQPQTIQAMLQTLKVQFETEALSPITQRVFPLTQATQAFRHMQQAQHIGKVVLALEPTSGGSKASVSEQSGAHVVANGTYLITGGTGGLGLATAKWLVEQGARHLALLSRGVSPNPAVEDWLKECARTGIEVLVLQADVSSKPQLASALKILREKLPFLKGVVHAAGQLHDGVLQQLDWKQMEQVLAPKAWGAWHLHQLTKQDKLDFFILYSSAASLLGSPGQGAHVAANSFLDALAHQRQAEGLPALSLNWGPWTEVGSAQGKATQQQMKDRGIGAIAPQQGIQALEQILTQFEVPQVGVIPIDWPQFNRQIHTQGSPKDLFFLNYTSSVSNDDETIRRSANSINSVLSSHNPSLLLEPSWRQQLSALPKRRHVAFITQALQSEVAKVLAVQDSTQVDLTTSFFDLGMDSLMAVELKNRLDAQTGYSIASTAIFEYPTLQSLAAHLADTFNSFDSSIAENSPSSKSQTPLPGGTEPYSRPFSEPSYEPSQKSNNLSPPDIELELAALETLLDRT